MPSRGISVVIDRRNETNPCRYCTSETGRGENCHAQCERYLSWHGERVADIEAKMQDFRKTEDYLLYKRDILPRSRRKNKR
jgi:methionyl-tRNA synthetase